MVLEPTIRDYAWLNDSSARPDEGAQLGDSCVGQASETHDSFVDGGSCKTVNTAATVPARALVAVNQQPQDAMFFHRYLQAFLLAWNRRFFNDTG